MDGWNSWMDGWMDRWMDGLIDGIHGWMDGWMHGLIDGICHVCVFMYTCNFVFMFSVDVCMYDV